LKVLLKGGAKMNVQNVGERYYCSICGNEVTVTKVGGGELVCCNQPMELVEEE
jgi:desulfoferrodoxin-like iron-binding protein